MFRTVLLFLVLAVASRDCAFLPDLQNTGIHLKSRHADQFTEGVRNWFRDAKNKGISKDSSIIKGIMFKPMDLNSGPILKLHKNMGLPMMEKLLIHPGNFMLDLSTLKFDPRRDWGFHIGGWYIIRKSESGDDLYSQKNIEDWANWNDFTETRESSNRVRGGNTVAKETYTTASIPDTTTTSDSDDISNSSEAAANAIDELSVEVLKPVAV